MTIHTKKPAKMAVIIENIPEELKRVPQWVAWQWVERNGKFDKPPINIRTGGPGSSTDESTWVAFEEAKSALPKLDGIGLALGGGVGLVGLDFDSCVDPATGFVKAEVEEILESLDTYAEISPSKTGIRAWMSGTFDKSKWRSKRGDIEVYVDKRYMTVSGNIYGGKKPIREIGDAFYSFMDKHLSREQPNKTTTASAAPVEHSDDDKRIKAAFLACQKVEIKEDESDGSGRLVRYCRQCHRAGLSAEGCLTVVRMLEIQHPFPKRFDDSQIRARYESARNQTQFGEAIQSPEKMKASKEDPSTVAKKIIEQSAVNGIPTLRNYADQFYSWRKGRFESIKDMKSLVCKSMDDEYSFVTNSVIGNVETQIKWRTKIDDSPSFLDNSDWQPKDCFATATDIIHLPSFTSRKPVYSRPATPEYFCTTAVDYPFIADDPGCPQFLAFLKTLWPNDPASVRLLQLWFGYCLTPQTSHHKLLLLVGPTRSGKGVIAEILQELLGPNNVSGPTLAGIATQFGLSGMLDKSLAIVSDARISPKADQATITERLLCISANDLLMIDRKGKSLVSTRLNTRLMILSNEVPRLADASNALASRMLILRTKESFLNREDIGLANRLKGELPGILHWAIKGWQTLELLGAFPEPESTRNDQLQMRQLSSPVASFLDEVCDMEGEINCGELFAQWQVWCGKNGFSSGTSGTFGQQLSAAAGIERVRKNFPKAEVERPYFYTGVSIAKRPSDCPSSS